MKAKEIMHKRVVTARPDTTLTELLKIFDDHRVTGVPVVGPQGHLVGVVSQTDLVRRERMASPRMVPDYHQLPDGGLRVSGFRMEIPKDVAVEAVMTPWVISFEEDTPVEELAQQMLAKQIHRVVITRDGLLCGIVTSLDLVRALMVLLSRTQKK